MSNNRVTIKVGWGSQSKKWVVHCSVYDHVGRVKASRYVYADSTAELTEEEAWLLMASVRREIEAFLPL